MVWLDCLRVHENVLMATSFFSKKKKIGYLFDVLNCLYNWVAGPGEDLTTIRWTMPIDPYIKLNTDGNAIGNLGLAGVWGILRDSSSGWLSGFSLNLGIATNNMAKRGLLPAWNLGFKFIQIELDSSTQLSWLTNRNDFIILIWCL